MPRNLALRRGWAQAELGCDPGKKVEDRLQTCQGPRIPDEKKNKVETVKGYGKLTGRRRTESSRSRWRTMARRVKLKAKNVLLPLAPKRACCGLRWTTGFSPTSSILSLKEIPKIADH